ncbi:GspH/FimT family pseudopilin [Thioalkalivibrio sp. ALJ2]|uniref:GspH/FimT family pseudopilin n=1 Tax=Thioalkalivibrio sp. ALJ2 TaxID=1261622 RepID=UPI00037888B2|nr:GspH/FimT family pseudopilin [Thioalkalivibrio sp. ALJ2]
MRKDALGLTLVELMVTLVAFAVLIGIAAPAFGNLVEQNRVTSATNSFLATLHLARSEAIRRGSPVTLCTSQDGATCSAAIDWDGGWLLYQNAALATQPPGPDAIVRVGQEAPRVEIAGNTPTRHYISFDALGQSQQLSGAWLMGTVSVCAGEGSGRAIVLSNTGRPRVGEATCG